MNDMSNKNWEYSKIEKQAIKKFEKDGYSVTILHRYISKDKLELEKDGFSCGVELPLLVNLDVQSYVKLLEQQFEMAKVLR